MIQYIYSDFSTKRNVLNLLNVELRVDKYEGIFVIRYYIIKYFEAGCWHSIEEPF